LIYLVKRENGEIGKWRNGEMGKLGSREMER